MIVKSSKESTEDLTGRSRVVWNVVTGWGSYLIIMVAGFILPRMIDQYVGQISLGIWDFCWSIVNYINFANLGLGSSVNRYVAKYRLNSDLESLNNIVSTVSFIQVGVAILVMSFTIGLTLALPNLFFERLGEEVYTARWVVFFLGSSIAAHFLCEASRGVITGCHRWDINNGINALSRVTSVILMVVSLMLGGGLYHLGLVYLLVVIVAEIVRVMFAFRVCSGLNVNLRYANFKQAKEMVRFGGKTIVVGLPPLLLVQTAGVLIVSTLGPAALAVFARPMALVRYIQTFVNRFTFIFTPTASALHEGGQHKDICDLVFSSVRFSVAFTLPIIFVLVIFGDVLLDLWMGEKYVNWTVIAIIASGYFLPLSQDSMIRILMGMNKHGRAGLLNLISISLIFVMVLFFVNLTGWSLEKCALLVVIPLTIGSGILLPLYACKQLNIPIRSYIWQSIAIPTFYALPFGLFLIASRLFSSATPLVAMFIGCVGGVLILSVVYWRYLLSNGHRLKLKQYLGLAS